MKSEARETPAPTVVPAPAERPSEAAPPELPPIDKLTIESDFRDFFHPKVDEDVRRAALRKLFSDPHFNVMDGLDVYIDDYSKSEPIPAAMLASLKQAQRILEWAKDTGEEKQGEAALDDAKLDESPAPEALPLSVGAPDASAENLNAESEPLARAEPGGRDDDERTL